MPDGVGKSTNTLVMRPCRRETTAEPSGRSFPFRVQPAPETRPFAGAAVSVLGRFLTALGMWGGAAILGTLGIPILFLLFSLGIVHETSPGYRPFQPGELVVFV